MQKTCLFIAITALTCWACHKSEDLADPIDAKKVHFSSIKEAYEDGEKDSLAAFLSQSPDQVNEVFTHKGLSQTAFCHAVSEGRIELVRVLIQQEKLKFNDEICNLQGFELGFSPMAIALYLKRNDLIQEIFDAKLFNPNLEQNYLIKEEKSFFGKKKISFRNSSLICHLVSFSLVEPFNLLMKSKTKVNLNTKCNLVMPVAWLALGLYKATPDPIQKEIAIGIIKNADLDLKEEYHGLQIFQFAFELKNLDFISVFYDRGAETKLIYTNKEKISAAFYVQNHPADYDQKFRDFFAEKAKAEQALAKQEEKRLCTAFLNDLSMKLKIPLSLSDIFDSSKLEKFFKKVETKINPVHESKKAEDLCVGLQFENTKYSNCKDVVRQLQVCTHPEP